MTRGVKTYWSCYFYFALKGVGVMPKENSSQSDDNYPQCINFIKSTHTIKDVPPKLQNMELRHGLLKCDSRHDEKR
jgi:hypothetical protein